MFVKSLTLKGFKSFADPVTLELQPGVNVVVGPNGSGKSNVIDAVAWVLGAQGARALRGGKMDDVIFAGTGKRPALGRAEVSLTIDNSDGRVPIEFSEVTITRTLFRSGESEYALNGVPCRLLDIQELLSDSGVGRQQHVIVSQGNLDAVLSARPEDRRMIIEEAAGVLKYRKRRERSQRRLESTEQNLERLQDLIREVRQQMRPLQKQAEAARRHGGVVGELRAVSLHVAGQDIRTLRHRLQNAAAEAGELEQRAAECRAAVGSAEQTVAMTEAELGTLDHEGLSEQVERSERVFERARGLRAVMTERRRSLSRDLVTSVSKDVVASLEADLAAVRAELDEVDADQAALTDPADELAHDEATAAQAWLEFEQQWGEGLPVADSEAAEVRGVAGALRSSVDGLRHDVARRRARAHELSDTLRSLADEATAHVERGRQAAEEQPSHARSRSEAEQADAEAEAQRAAAEQAERAAEQATSVADTRVEVLTGALDASRARAGVERLAELDGVVGTLAEMVEVDDGYQAAFEAAAGDAMSAVVVDDIDSARAALAHLRGAHADGAVLVRGQPAHPPGGVPDGVTEVEALRPHVRGASPAVDQLLDRVLCCCVVAEKGWSSAVDLAITHPDLVVVTLDGDRFARSAWRVGSGAEGATSAALQAAQTVAANARESLVVASTALGAADEMAEEARLSVRIATRALDANARATADVESALERCRSRQSAATSELTTVDGDIADLEGRLSVEEDRLAQLEARLPGLEAEERTGAERADAWRAERSGLEDRSTVLRRRRSEMELRTHALADRATSLTRRSDDLVRRLTQHRDEVDQAAERRIAIESAIRTISRLQEVTDRRFAEIEVHLGEVRIKRDSERRRQRDVADRLEAARQLRSGAEGELVRLAERRQQHEVRQAEARLRLEAVLEGLAEQEITADEALAAKEPELPPGTTGKQRVNELERELRTMGPVNPLALEEFEAVQERHQFLDQQMQDVQRSRRELMHVIRTVDTEIVESFRTAYEDVARNFTDLFGALFPGGSGGLRLTDPENLLETGIEIEARPSGKNVRTLSLLSGGERSLAALAFLFAVFRARPSPFYLLDEVEAALDDVNLHRFLTLVQEFRNEAQLVIVTHQKRTMETADTLYGVTMAPGGSSKVVSERVQVDLTTVAS